MFKKFRNCLKQINLNKQKKFNLSNFFKKMIEWAIYRC